MTATTEDTGALRTSHGSHGSPDPIQLAQADMKRLKTKIKGVIERKLGSGDSTHPMLKSSSKEFFERKEKTWRPMAALLLSKAMPVNGVDRETFLSDAMVIAEIIEIMHTSTMIHDTVLEDYQALEKGNVAHRMYSSSMAGNKVSILAGDFLLSRASVLLASLRNTEVVEIMAGALEAIMKGQMFLHRPVEMKQSTGMEQYLTNVETRTGQLLAAGCQCAALVAGHSRDSPISEAAFQFGLNLGSSYQLTNDLKVTERNYEKLLKKMEDCMKAEQGECSFDPYELNEPLQRAGPLLYAADVYPELKHSSVEGFDDVSALLRARELIVECKAVQAVRKMALDRSERAKEALMLMSESEEREALRTLCDFVVDAQQSRLQRVNYMEDGGFVEPKEQSKSGTQLVEALKDAKKGAKLGMFSMKEQVKEQFDRWRGNRK